MPERKKMSRRKSFVITGLTVGMYIVYVILLFWYHPFVASAEETAEKQETIPGGVGNIVMANSVCTLTEEDHVIVRQVRFESADNWELLGYFDNQSAGLFIQFLQYNSSTGQIFYFLNSLALKDCTGYFTNTKNGKVIQSENYSMNNLLNSIQIGPAADMNDRVYTYSISGCKVFQDKQSAQAYCDTGSLDGMIKEPVLDKDWVLKNVRGIVTADDSPSSEAGEDATYIRFTWDTDNLQEGDLLEIKTHNYYKTLNGEEHGGFYDYITKANNVSAFTGEYGPFSQYEATKAWYKSLDYHPLFFKSYDTDIYFLRPIRNGKVGGWVKVFMRRNSLTKAPDVEKVEYGDFDKEGNWTVNKELTEKEGGYGTDHFGNKVYPDTDNPFEGTNISGIFKSFFDFFKDIPSMLGGLPGLVNSTIGFLPNWVIGFIAIGIVVVIILRIVGR